MVLSDGVPPPPSPTTTTPAPVVAPVATPGPTAAVEVGDIGSVTATADLFDPSLPAENGCDPSGCTAALTRVSGGLNQLVLTRCDQPPHEKKMCHLGYRVLAYTAHLLTEASASGGRESCRSTYTCDRKLSSGGGRAECVPPPLIVVKRCVADVLRSLSALIELGVF